MKNGTFKAGILGIILVFGLTLVGCDNGTTDNGGDSNP
jgi:hypothetical protein